MLKKKGKNSTADEMRLEYQRSDFKKRERGTTFNPDARDRRTRRFTLT
jgi:hypothetical protein